jgi:hypothetical protein
MKRLPYLDIIDLLRHVAHQLEVELLGSAKLPQRVERRAEWPKNATQPGSRHRGVLSRAEW